MWRDGRKYDIFLHVLAQTVSELPPGILSSCNNGFFGQTKDDKDRHGDPGLSGPQYERVCEFGL